MILILALCLFVSPAYAGNGASKMPANGDCIVQGKYDPVISRKKLTECSTVEFGDLSVSSNQQLDLTNLKTGLNINFKGIITFSVRYDNKYKLMHITGSNLKITASPNAWFDALGAQYWDGGGYYKGSQKPMFAMIEVKDSTLIDLKVRNTPAHAFMIACSEHSTFQNFKVDDSAGDRQAKNTDGIHILQSTSITVVGAEIKNQDDCVCITSGDKLNITGITCLGGGLSIGSVGRNANANDVTKVIFSHSTITNSLYGVLVKTWVGGHGLVDQVTFEDINLKNIRMYGVAISQGYTNEGITSEPTDGVSITNLILRRVTGNVSPGAQKVLVRCGSTKSCLQFFWEGVQVSDGIVSKGNTNVPEGARNFVT